MTTAWRCAPCKLMRRIQITQWSGSRACNLLAKIEFRWGWLRWREWDCVGALLGRCAADRVAATRARASQAVFASCHCNQNFCPPSGSDTHLQIRRAPRSAATWVDVIIKSIVMCIYACLWYLWGLLEFLILTLLGKVWDKITCLIPNFKCRTVEVLEWISNVIQIHTIYVQRYWIYTFINA